MKQPPELKLPLARAFKIFLCWAIPVYVLPLLSFATSQWSVLRSWIYHLTFLIPAVVVGGIGALVLTNSAPSGSFRAAVRGAATGLAASLVGALTTCGTLTASASPGSEGSSWYGILQIPGIFLATVTGFVIGIYANPQQDSNST